MTEAEKHIAHYNRLKNKPIAVSKLKAFNDQVAGSIESAGVNRRALETIHERISAGLKKVGRQRVVNVVLSPIASYKRRDVALTLGDCYGLPHLQNETQGTALDGLDDVYEIITKMILDAMKKDGLVWRKPWNAKRGYATGQAHNYVTKSYYSGANYYLNWLAPLKGYTSPYYFTMNQVDALKGRVKKGAKSWPIVYYKELLLDVETKKTITEAAAKQLISGRGLKKKFNGSATVWGYEKDGKFIEVIRKFPSLFYYKVFNYEDCEGLKIKPFQQPMRSEKQKIETAEKIVENMPKAPPIGHGGDSAHYRPSSDTIQMPHMDDFDKEQEYYSTLFHEMVHSTGHGSRIGRDLTGRFGSKSYAFEELIAELGASYLCGESGILYFTLDNTAAYVSSWSKRLKSEMEEDPKFFLRASAAAQKAADFILDKKKEAKQEKRVPAVKKKETVRVKPRAARKAVPRKRATPMKPPRAARPLSIAGVVDAAALKGSKFRKIPLKGKYQHDFQAINSDTQVMIWGPPGNGKTVYLLEMAQYLAGTENLNTLFVENEEWGRSTFAEKIEMFGIGHARLKFAKTIPPDLSPFEVIFLDSVQSLRLDLEGYKKLRDQYPEKIFVLIVQSTKDGDFRGGQDWEHEVDVAGEVRNRRLLLRKNRLDPSLAEKAERIDLEQRVAQKQKANAIKRKAKEIETAASYENPADS